MLAEVGSILIGLALAAALYAAFAAFWSIRKEARSETGQSKGRRAESGRNGVYASSGLLALALLALLVAFLPVEP